MRYNTVESNGRISVCYSANGKIFGGIVLSVLSVLSHTPRPLTFYLLTMYLQTRTKCLLLFPKDKRKSLIK